MPTAGIPILPIWDYQLGNLSGLGRCDPAG